MSISPVTSSALRGIEQEQRRLGGLAHDSANISTPGYDPAARGAAGAAEAKGPNAGGQQETRASERAALESQSLGVAGISRVDLAQQAIGRITGHAAYRANLAMLKTADELSGTLLDRQAG